MQASANPHQHNGGEGRQTPYGNTGAGDHGFRVDAAGMCVDPESNSDEKSFACVIHGLGLLALLDFSGILTAIIVFILWKVRGSESPFIDDHGRDAMNFQLTLLLYGFALFFLTIVSIGILAPVAVLGGVGMLVLRLVGSIRGMYFANKGCYYRYPMCIRFIS